MTNNILTACGIIIMAVVSYILVPLIKRAGAAVTARVEEKTKSEKLAQAVERASVVVEQVVVAVTQTYVDDLKKSGSFDGDAQKQALTMAKEAAASLISDEVQRLITEHYNDFSEWLLSAIEAAVARSKWEAKQ
jgi:hypothetical protein